MSVLLKPIELRVMPIAGGGPDKHGASEQTLAPERHQSTGIEVTRMDRPEPQLFFERIVTITASPFAVIR